MLVAPVKNGLKSQLGLSENKRNNNRKTLKQWNKIQEDLDKTSALVVKMGNALIRTSVAPTMGAEELRTVLDNQVPVRNKMQHKPNGNLPLVATTNKGLSLPQIMSTVPPLVVSTNRRVRACSSHILACTQACHLLAISPYPIRKPTHKQHPKP